MSPICFLNLILYICNMEENTVITETVNETEKLNNANIIKNVSYDQTEILHNIGIIYNNGSDQFDADMTASMKSLSLKY